MSLDDLTLAELLGEVMSRRLATVHTGGFGRVESYDEDSRTMDVKPMWKQAHTNEAGDRVSEELPVIPHVPILWDGMGGNRIRFEVTRGDFVWLCFSEASLDRFLHRGKLEDTGDDRRCHLTDAVALPVLFRVGGALTAGMEIMVKTAGIYLAGEAGAVPVAKADATDEQIAALWSALNGHRHSASPGGGITSSAIVMSAAYNAQYPSNPDLSNPPHGTDGHVHGSPEPTTIGAALSGANASVAATFVYCK